MMKTFNTLDENTYLFDKELDSYIRSGKIDINNPNYNNYIYLIRLKRFDNENMYIYSYIEYNMLFGQIIIEYFLNRFRARNLIREELKQTLILIDDSLVKNYRDLDGLSLTEDEVTNLIYSTDLDTDKDQIYRIYELILYISFGCSLEEIAEKVKLDLDRNYYALMYSILAKIEKIRPDYELKTEIVDSFNDKAETLFNPMDNCLIVCSDREGFINKLKQKDISISQGPKNVRGLVSRMDSYISTLDMDIRNTMFYHHRHHYYKQSFLKNFDMIPRHKFSYKNIHMNLGRVRWFSSSPITNADVASAPTKYFNNRQDLFMDNYKVIRDLLEKNSNLILYDTQKEIELFLVNQESRFTDENSIGYNMYFNHKNYDFINKKKLEIESYISKIEYNKSKPDIIKYWVNDMVATMGSSKISDLLLSFFMEILSKESVEDDDENETPGIPAVFGFEKFGNKMVNKYIQMRYFSFLKKESISITLSSYKLEMAEQFKEFNDETFNGRLGGYFIRYLLDTNLLYQMLDVKSDNPREKELYLRINEDIRSLFLKEKKDIIHTPQCLPMVCKPKDYVYSTDPKANLLGGYLLNDVNYTDYLIKKKPGYEIDTELEKSNMIIDLVNGLNKTPYKINKDVLNFIVSRGYQKNILTDQSSKKLQNFINNPYKSSYTKQDRNELRSLYSKILLEKNIINIADCFANLEKIYFPVRLDQRTRIYCETDYFDYQKNDLAKGLVLFAEPGKLLKIDIDVINYLKGYGANMFGLDKRSINFKVKWIDSNSDWILDFRNNDAVNKAENKTCFLAFCFEYERFINFYNNPESTEFKTYLPIQLDASCNGYQHLALLTRETNMFNKLNLSKSTPGDAPDDFYTYLKDKINKYISDKVNVLKGKCNKTIKENSLLDSLHRLLNFKLDRSVVKKSFMTNSYNASHPRLVQNIVSALQEKKLWDNNLIKREDISNYIVCLKEVLNLELPKISELGKYLDKIAIICTKLDMGIPWTLPSGAMITESYMVAKQLKIKAFSFMRAKYTFYRFIQGKYSLKQQKRSTMPNLIHTLDASTIALLFKDYKNRLYTVHDCFATTADNVPLLMDTLKSVYLEMYSNNDYLIQFDKVVKTNINNKWGDEIFNLNNSFISIPSKKKRGKPEIIEFPDINKVLKNQEFERKDINNLVNSSYIII